MYFSSFFYIVTILSTIRAELGKQCTNNNDCSLFEWCNKNYCSGIVPDTNDTRLLRCVDGYICELNDGLPGYGITNKIKVIGISPDQYCGEGKPLTELDSVFPGLNMWQCNDNNSSYCILDVGVGMRKNKSIIAEGIRLCGCPNKDVNNLGFPCSSHEDYILPLGRLAIQECLTNAHCIHKLFAYCVIDKCSNFAGVFATMGMNFYKCLLGKDCTIENIASRTLSQSLKIVPVMSKIQCGIDMALDPNYFEENSLPCIVDLNNDGKCDVNLGLAKTLSTNRLCGCSGVDRGGNGRPCDEPEDFNLDFGLVDTVECNVDDDCTAGLCAMNACVIDNSAPKLINTSPQNNTIAIPPIRHIIFHFSETILFPLTDDDKFIHIVNPTANHAYKIPIIDPTIIDYSTVLYRVKIEGKELIVTPDIRIESLPEGDYFIGFESGIVMDLDGNFVEGSKNIQFKILKYAGCPYLGITGLSINPVNVNGVYFSGEAYNDRPTWLLKSPNNDFTLILYYSYSGINRLDKENLNNTLMGKWVISPIGFQDKQFYAKLDQPYEQIINNIRPVSGLWKTYQSDKWIEHEYTIVHCMHENIPMPPILEASTGIDINEKIKLTFNKPVTYGHWSSIRLLNLDTGQVEYKLDPETADVRKNNIYFENNNYTAVIDFANKLNEGTRYTLSIDTGAFTDLEYNPNGPLQYQKYEFTTKGRQCKKPLSELFPAMMCVGNCKSEYKDNEKVNLTCHSFYSFNVEQKDYMLYNDRIYNNNLADAEITFTFICKDSEWDTANITCMADCGDIALKPSTNIDLIDVSQYTIHDMKDANLFDIEPEIFVNNSTNQKNSFDQYISNQSSVDNLNNYTDSSTINDYTDSNNVNKIVTIEKTTKNNETDSIIPLKNDNNNTEMRTNNGGSTRNKQIPIKKQLKYVGKVNKRLIGSKQLRSLIDVDIPFEQSKTIEYIELNSLNKNYRIFQLMHPTNSLQVNKHDRSAAEEDSKGQRKYKHGSQIRIICSKYSELLSGHLYGEISTCLNGRWTNTSIICADTCGEIKLPSRAYKLDKKNSYQINAMRLVTCANNTINIDGDSQVIKCNEDKQWDEITLDCRIPCEKLKLNEIKTLYGLVPIDDITAVETYTNIYNGYAFKCASNHILNTLGNYNSANMKKKYFNSDLYQNCNSTNSSVCIACYDGYWQRETDFICEEQCNAIKIGDGYITKLLHGNGTEPGTTYEIYCKDDAIAIPDILYTEKIVCNKGSWIRLEDNLRCYSSCLHPLLYFKSNYIVKDLNDAELTISNLIPIEKLTYRHLTVNDNIDMQKLFKIMCQPYTQTIYTNKYIEPNISNAELFELANTNRFNIRMANTMHELPYQYVACNDGKWTAIDITEDDNKAKHLNLQLRCLKTCSELNNLENPKYHVFKDFTVEPWMQKYKIYCRDGLMNGFLIRNANLTLQFVSKLSYDMICINDSWMSISNLDVDSTIFKNTNNYSSDYIKLSTGDIASKEFGESYPCGRDCSLLDLTNNLILLNIDLVGAVHSDNYQHGTILKGMCKVNYYSFFPHKYDYIACSDSEWTRPLLLCLNNTQKTYFLESILTKLTKSLIENKDNITYNDTDLKIISSIFQNNKLEFVETNLQVILSQNVDASEDVLGYEELLKLHNSTHNIDSSETLKIVIVRYKENFALPISLQPQLQSMILYFCYHNLCIYIDKYDKLHNTNQIVEYDNCNNKKYNRLELNLDCGGICNQTCSSCFDNILNGDEQWIDCGGTCAPCKKCTDTQLKRFHNSRYYIETTHNIDINTILQLNNTVVTDQVRLFNNLNVTVKKVSCSNNSKSKNYIDNISFICLNEHWIPKQTIEYMVSSKAKSLSYLSIKLPVYDLECQEILQRQLENNIFLFRKLIPENVSMSYCSGITKQYQDNYNYLETCCDLFHEVIKFMNGECMSLLYTYNTVSFCTGRCNGQVRAITNRLNEFIVRINRLLLSPKNIKLSNNNNYSNMLSCHETLDKLQSILLSICSKMTEDEIHNRKSTKSELTISYQTIESTYCLDYLRYDIMHLQTLDIYKSKDENRMICSNNSCFKLNAKIINNLWAITHDEHIFMKTGNMAIIEKNNYFLGHHELSNNNFQSHIINRDIPILKNIRYSENFVNLLCLTSHLKHSCVTKLKFVHDLLLFSENTNDGIVNKLDLIKNFSSAKLCESDACFTKIIRSLGSLLTVASKTSNNNQQYYLGELFKLYGRYYCIKNYYGQSCAVNILGDFTEKFEPYAFKKHYDMPIVLTQIIRGFVTKKCDCKIDYINDGMCDSACFNADCGYDGLDCFFFSMYPDLYARIKAGIDFENTLLPFIHKSYYDELKKQQYSTIEQDKIRNGCCTSIKIYILKELLDKEYLSHPLLNSKESRIINLKHDIFEYLSHNNENTLSDLLIYNKYKILPLVIDDPNYQLYSDHTCSNENNNISIIIEVEVEYINYFALLSIKPIMSSEETIIIAKHLGIDKIKNTSVIYEHLSKYYPEIIRSINIYYDYNKLIHIIVRKLSDKFIIPTSDIKRIYFNPIQSTNGTNCIIEFFSTQFINELEDMYNQLYESNSLSSIFNQIFDDWLNNISETLKKIMEEGIIMSMINEMRLLHELYDENAKASYNNRQIKVRFYKHTGNNSEERRTKIKNTVYQDNSSNNSCRIDNLFIAKENRYHLRIEQVLVNTQIVNLYYISCKNSPVKEDNKELTKEQEIICLNNKWITVNNKALMNCNNSCEDYQLIDYLNNSEKYQVIYKNNFDIQTVEISCAPGYKGESAIAQCINSKWTQPAINCVKNINHDLVCNNVNFNVIQEKFGLVINEAKPKFMHTRWWSVGCKKGMRDPFMSGKNYYLACIDDFKLILLKSIDYRIKMMTQIGKPISDIESIFINQLNENDLKKDFFSIDLNSIAKYNELHLQSLDNNSNNITINCQEAYVYEPLLNGNTNFSDILYIIIVGSVAAIFTIIFCFFGYVYQKRKSKIINRIKYAAYNTDNKVNNKKNGKEKSNLNTYKEPYNNPNRSRFSYYSDIETYTQNNYR